MPPPACRWRHVAACRRSFFTASSREGTLPSPWRSRSGAVEAGRVLLWYIESHRRRRSSFPPVCSPSCPAARRCFSQAPPAKIGHATSPTFPLCTCWSRPQHLVASDWAVQRRLPRARSVRRRAQSRRGQSSPVGFSFNQIASEHCGESLITTVLSV